MGGAGAEEAGVEKAVAGYSDIVCNSTRVAGVAKLDAGAGASDHIDAGAGKAVGERTVTGLAAGAGPVRLHR